MIRYSLVCARGHGFDSWFQTAAAYDRLRAAGQVGCPLCGDTGIEKTLMAPAVRPARQAEARQQAVQPAPGTPVPAGVTPPPGLRAPPSELEQAIAALRREIEANSDYVGLNFAAEARRMHAGEVPERAIHGEARPDEARKLIEDGVPVAPLPFLPARKVN
jgi:hypothetical protein